MADRLLLYISAASDLRAEREVLGRAVTEVPVLLAWRVVHSPGGDEPVDVDAVSRADVHLLLLGGDIRAPVGLEWRYALLAGRKPVPFLKQDALRTPAGEHFLRFVRQRAAWRPFRDPADLRRQFLALLAGHVIDRAIHYRLSPVELARLEEWRTEIAAAPSLAEEGGRGAGESGVILSRERFVPSEGVLIDAERVKRSHPEGQSST
jgi:hypothetical protein